MATVADRVECLAKLEALSEDKRWLHDVAAQFIGGPRASEEALYEATGVIFRLLTGRDAGHWPVYDKLGRDWSPTEIDAAHDLLEWLVKA